MRLVLLLNDNSYNSSSISDLCTKYHEMIVAVILSNRLLPGKNRSFFASLWFFLKQCGFFVFLFRAIEMLSYKFKRYCKYLGLYPQQFDLLYFFRSHEIPILNCEDINSPEFLSTFRNLNSDLAFSRINQIMKREIIDIPKRGIINFHCSLLPKYQGLDTVFWGMHNGEKNFGVTAHFVVPEVDSGNIVKQRSFLDTKGLSLHALESLLNEMVSSLMVDVFELFQKAEVVTTPMPIDGESYNSFPTNEAYRRFTNRGKRLITFRQVLASFCKGNTSTTCIK